MKRDTRDPARGDGVSRRDAVQGGGSHRCGAVLFVTRMPLNALRSPRMLEHWTVCGARARDAPTDPPQRRHHRQHGPEGRRLREGGPAHRRQEDRQRGRRSGKGAAPGAGDRRHEHDRHSRIRRRAPPFVGGAASPHHSGRRHRDYMATTHNGFARYYRPHDIYVGNLITALGCIDAGITCVIDNSHNSRSAAHSDAAVQALIDSGIRGVTRRARRRLVSGTGSGRRIRTAAEAVLRLDRPTGHVADVLRDEP